VTVALLSTGQIYTFSSSPGLKGYVRYCYHLGSVVVVRKLLHLNLLLGNYWVNWNQLGRNVYFDGPLKVRVFLLMRNTQKKQEAQRCNEGVFCFCLLRGFFLSILVGFFSLCSLHKSGLLHHDNYFFICLSIKLSILIFVCFIHTLRVIKHCVYVLYIDCKQI
jgi:hypothetical protein